jgi:hypothetical protein
MTALLVLMSTTLAAAAQTPPAAPIPQAADRHVPMLADLMASAQSRHIKLWFAGNGANWDLAAYELARLKASLVDAATLYPGLPVTDLTTMSKPVDSLAKVIAAKDTAKFAEGFNQLTAGCNGCHQAMERGFIALRVPTASPFSDQSFAPRQKAQGN